MEILEANPEVLRNDDLLDYLENNIPSPLSSGDITELETESVNNTDRSDLESEIAYYAAQKELYGNLVVKHYLMDSTGMDTDSIDTWLDSVGTLAAAYMKVAYYTGRGDYTAADAILDDIPTNFSLTSEESDQYSYYVQVWDLLKDVHDDGRTVLQLESEETDQLDNILGDTSAVGKVVITQVGVVINQHTQTYNASCLPIHEGEKPGRNISRNNNEENKNLNTYSSKNSIIRAYPNPASNFVIFEYNLLKTNGQLILTITTTTGQKLQEIPFNGKSGRYRWETPNVPAGVYIYELTDAGKSVDVGRIVITK